MMKGNYRIILAIRPLSRFLGLLPFFFVTYSYSIAAIGAYNGEAGEIDFNELNRNLPTGFTGSIYAIAKWAGVRAVEAE